MTSRLHIILDMLNLAGWCGRAFRKSDRSLTTEMKFKFSVNATIRCIEKYYGFKWTTLLVVERGGSTHRFETHEAASITEVLKGVVAEDFPRYDESESAHHRQSLIEAVMKRVEIARAVKALGKMSYSVIPKPFVYTKDTLGETGPNDKIQIVVCTSMPNNYITQLALSEDILFWSWKEASDLQPPMVIEMDTFIYEMGDITSVWDPNKEPIPSKALIIEKESIPADSFGQYLKNIISQVNRPIVVYSIFGTEDLCLVFSQNASNIEMNKVKTLLHKMEDDYRKKDIHLQIYRWEEYRSIYFPDTQKYVMKSANKPIKNTKNTRSRSASVEYFSPTSEEIYTTRNPTEKAKVGPWRPKGGVVDRTRTERNRNLKKSISEGSDTVSPRRIRRGSHDSDISLISTSPSEEAYRSADSAGHSDGFTRKSPKRRRQYTKQPRCRLKMYCSKQSVNVNCGYFHPREELRNLRNGRGMTPKKIYLCRNTKCRFRNDPTSCSYAHGVRELFCTYCERTGHHYADCPDANSLDEW